MLKDEWKQLKSGTDIRGVAMEGVEGQPVQLTDEVVERIIASFAAVSYTHLCVPACQQPEKGRFPGSLTTNQTEHDLSLIHI